MYKETVKKLPIYKGYFGVVITDNEKKLWKKYRFDTDCLYGHTFMTSKRTRKGNDKRIVLFIFNPVTTVKLRPELITHESVHGVSFIFDRIDKTIDIKNDEDAAYLAEYFSKHIFKFFKKCKVKL